MTSAVDDQTSSSLSQQFIRCESFWNNAHFLSEKREDKRLLTSSKIEQPTHLKFARRQALDLVNAKFSDESRAGYNPYRGDFEIEFRNKAEYSAVLASYLNSCCHYKDQVENGEEDNFPGDLELLENLQVVLIQHYNSVLRERERRKNIIKKHGLMNKKGTSLWFSRLETSLGKSQAKKLVRLCPLTSADEMEHLSVSLGNLNTKRAEVNKLIFVRTQRGITSKWDMSIFETERKRKEIGSSLPRIDVRNIATPPTAKRKRQAVEIFHLPRYKELTPKEAELCSMNGLEPSFYLDIKDFLIADCKKNNGLLLKKARKLVKIDVNKTRKIFDLLLEEGHTWTPDQGQSEDSRK